eukprot:NODE_59_length_25653_cov_0.289622.p16 type:complete len:131 gc:universal NODE_59_length_25653_cov_0.289622:1826-2218(+)
MLKRLSRFASHGEPVPSISEHIERVEKQLVEAQKEWNKGERINQNHAGIILGGIAFVYVVSEAKKNKENFVSRYIAHKMTSDVTNDTNQMNRIISQQSLSESRLLLSQEPMSRFSVADPYLDERGSPFNI